MPDGCHRDKGQSYTLAFARENSENLSSRGGAQLSRPVDSAECEPGHSTLLSMG